MSAAPHIVISGNIGTGKSKVTSHLADELGLEAYLEPSARSPYLEAFYEDKSSFALRSQLYFLKEGLSEHRRINERGVGAIQERSVYEHHLVVAQALRADGYLDEDDFKQLAGIFWAVEDLLAPPTLLVYLDAPVDVLAARGRAGVDRAYLERLDACYRAFLDNWVYSPVLRLDTVAMDVTAEDGLDQAAQIICDRLSGLGE